jgi:cellulose synthase/poly-beta-1,6-N-acetylglucosamine synthase-like glycosyltransferase
MRPLNGCEVRDGEVTGCDLPSRWLVRFQLMEYANVFLANRLGWSALNAVPVLSGGISLWRKDTLREMGGFSVTTTHEDLDTTIRLHQRFHEAEQDYRIVYLPDAVAWTEVPHTWRGIYRQRKRWQRALFESVWRGRKMWFNPRYGTVGMMLMPYLLLYEALGPIVEIMSWVLTLALLVLGIADPLLLLAFLVTAAGLTAATRLAALVIDLVFYQDRSVGDLLRLGATGLLEFWIYRPYLLVARVHALAEFLTGHSEHERTERLSRTA